MDNQENGIKIGGDVKDCCKKESNLVIRAKDQKPGRPDITVRRCKVCGCRHISAEIEPGVIGVIGSKF